MEQGKQIASHALEASAGDIEFKNGKFVVAGTDREIGIMELAQKVRTGMALPSDEPQSLDVKHVSEGSPAAYPNGCHVCEVEVDPDTGVTRDREVPRGQRLRHHHQSAAGRRPDARRRRAGHRPVPAGRSRFMTTRASC